MKSYTTIPESMPAQLDSPSGVELAAWLGCLFFLVAGWNQVEKFLERRTGRPLLNPPATHAPDSTASVDAFCRSEVSGLRDKINKVDRELGEMRACIEVSRQQLIHIDAKLDRVIERNS